MSDVQSTPRSPRRNPWKMFWEYLDILKALALIVIGSYIAIVASGGTADETHKNMALLAMGFYFGSSLGSRSKDPKDPPSPPPAGG